MRNFLQISVVIYLLLIHFGITAQDFHFTQARYATMYVNPALTGADFSQQASIIYKDQWRTITNPYKTIYAGYDMRFREKESWTGYFAGGISVLSDKAGDAKMGLSQVNVTFAYHVILTSKITLGGAIQSGFSQRSMNFNELKWGSQYDGQGFNNAKASGESNFSGNVNFFDISSGIVFSYKKGERKIKENNSLNINTGFAVYHITQPEYSYFSISGERLLRKYTFLAQSLIGMNYTKQSIMPSIYYTIQGKQQELLFGSYIRYKVKDKSSRIDEIKGQAIAAGIFYRNKDAVVIKFLYQMANYNVGLSYDFNVSPLRKVSGYNGGIELMIQWVTPDPFNDNITRF